MIFSYQSRGINKVYINSAKIALGVNPFEQDLSPFFLENQISLTEFLTNPEWHKNTLIYVAVIILI
jgi:hypothetical protein